MMATLPQIYTARFTVASDGTGVYGNSITLPTDLQNNTVAELIRVNAELSTGLSFGTDDHVRWCIAREAPSVSTTAQWHLDDDHILYTSGWQTDLVTSGAVGIVTTQTYDFLPGTALIASELHGWVYCSTTNPQIYFQVFYQLRKVSAGELINMLT